MEPSHVEELIYPPKNIRKEDIPMPDFERYYERMMTKGSRANMFTAGSTIRANTPMVIRLLSSMNTFPDS